MTLPYTIGKDRFRPIGKLEIRFLLHVFLYPDQKRGVQALGEGLVKKGYLKRTANNYTLTDKGYIFCKRMDYETLNFFMGTSAEDVG